MLTDIAVMNKRQAAYF